MKQIITICLFLFSIPAFAQNDFSSQIQKVSDTIAKKIVQTGNKKVAVTGFVNLDESSTQLGQFLCDELSSELSNLTDNLTKFEVIERTNVDLIFKEKNLIQSVDGSKMAKELGKLNAADILIWAIISDFEGYYRVNIKLLDTRTGSALGAFKTQFIKTPTLESYNKQTIKKSDIASDNNSTTVPVAETKTEPKKVSAPDPCEQKLTGSVTLSNKVNAGVNDNAKIVVRIPKPGRSSGYDLEEAWFFTLDRGETKDLTSLKEGTYEYDVKMYDPNFSKGWCGGCGSVSSGQIEITKCKQAILEIR